MNNFKFETDEPKSRQDSRQGGGETMIKLDFGAYDDVPQEDSHMENQQSDDLGESFENEQDEMQDEAEIGHEQLPETIAQNDINEPDQLLLNGGIPNIREMIQFSPFTNLTLFDLDKVANLNLIGQVRCGAQTSIRTNLSRLANFSLLKV